MLDANNKIWIKIIYDKSPIGKLTYSQQSILGACDYLAEIPIF